MALGTLLWLGGCADTGPDASGLEVAEPVVEPDLPLGWRDVAPDSALYLSLLRAEDRRAPSPTDLEAFRTGFASPHAGLRRASARGWGRLERPELAGELAPLLDDPDAAVRREAANALAQAVRGVRAGSPEAARVVEATGLLLARLDAEEEALTRAALLRSIGRLPLLDSIGAAQAQRILAGAFHLPPDSAGTLIAAPPTVQLGLARGAASLFRSALPLELPLDTLLLARLELLVQAGDAQADAVRRAALTARVVPGGVPPALLASALDDVDPGVRRIAAGALGLARGEELRPLIERALADSAAEVRVEGVRSWGRALQASAGCDPLLDRARDESTLVALVALDALGGSCPGGEGAASALLTDIAGSLATAPSWHRPTRAFVSLARVDAAAARPLLAGFAGHADPFARAHAAAAAGVLGERTLLRTLARDRTPNVREAAVRALVPLEGRGADSILIAQLELDDPQLLQTSARLLEGTRQGGPAIPALFRALGRLTAQNASTSRDARVALLTRIGELGSFWQATQVDPYLGDFDPVVARTAATILTGWTGEPERAGPRGLPTLPLPTLGELRDLELLTAHLEMETGETFVLRLFPFEAPTNAARFARMAADGTFDGLTLHRVVPNFVLQGGSPGANEYAGHGAFTRDEIGVLGHWRGTVGISTRGRDTGDGQIFINTVDNLRLDHDYTVFAEVVEGADSLPFIQEGARIRTVRLVRPEER